MADEIKVYVVDYGPGRNLMLRYLDPLTNRQVTKSAGTRKRSEADKLAGKWQAELREGRYQKPGRMAWETVREYYATNAMPALAKSSVGTYEGTLNVIERLCNPQKLADVTTTRVTAFVTALRTEGRSEATMACHLRHLKAAMRWANREGLLNTLPKFTMPKRVKGAKVMRGRAVTLEEFERMIEAVPKIVDNAAAKSWEFYLRGLWASGLRLSESLRLRWDDAPESIVVDITGAYPMLRISAEVEKGGKDRLLPMTPDFARVLQAVPEREGRGRVFKLVDTDGTPLHGGQWVVGKIVSKIGKAAGVVVDERTKGDKFVRKFASAHDLRRAFGQRLAAKGVAPTDLKTLMRHEDISTTMKYYIGSDADATAGRLWAAFGNNLGNSDHTNEKSGAKSTANSSTGERT